MLTTTTTTTTYRPSPQSATPRLAAELQPQEQAVIQASTHRP